MDSRLNATRSGPPLGAVLAGGAATRLGGAKATVELAGLPLIAYPLAALAQAAVDHVVVAKADSPLPTLDITVITEPDGLWHPLAGVVAAMDHSGARPVLVVPCDAPFLTSMLLRILASATKTTAVRSAGRVHPLIALYLPEAKARLEEAVLKGEPATEALESLEPEYIEAPEREIFNVNTPEDLAQAEMLLKQPRS